MSPARVALAFALRFSVPGSPAFAQTAGGSSRDWGLDLTVGGAGLAIGHVPRVNGIRINFRDRHLEEVNGLNLTLWAPHRDADLTGTVRGLATDNYRRVVELVQAGTIGHAQLRSRVQVQFAGGPYTSFAQCRREGLTLLRQDRRTQVPSLFG